MRKLIIALVLAVFIPASASAITVTVYYDWECDGTYGSSTVTANTDGTFTTSDDYSGTWGIFGGVVNLKFEDGCCPLYVFSLASHDGQHKCTDGSQDCYAYPGCDYFTVPLVGVDPTPDGDYSICGSYVGPMVE